MTNDDLVISLTAVRSYQRCEQQYYYRYIEGLSRRDKAPAPELGILLHEYLEHYYKLVAAGATALEAHETSLDQLREENTLRLELSASIAHMAGADEMALVILGLVPKACRIADRYFSAHGLADANRYDFILIEEKVQSEILPHVLSKGKIDMVTRDRSNGRTHLWEHKSVTTEPPQGVRLFDLQTPLYDSQLEIEIDAVQWNYLRTKEPTEPGLLKRGGLSHDKSIDTTWECYSKAIKDNGLSFADYDDMRALLDGRELNIFFPRYEQVIISSEEVLLGDYKETAREIWRSRKRWREDKARPIRSLARDCEFWCEYKQLCYTALTGGDEEDMIDLRFKRTPRTVEDAPTQDD